MANVKLWPSWGGNTWLIIWRNSLVPLKFITTPLCVICRPRPATHQKIRSQEEWPKWKATSLTRLSKARWYCKRGGYLVAASPPLLESRHSLHHTKGKTNNPFWLGHRQRSTIYHTRHNYNGSKFLGIGSTLETYLSLSSLPPFLKTRYKKTISAIPNIIVRYKKFCCWNSDDKKATSP